MSLRLSVGAAGASIFSWLFVGAGFSGCALWGSVVAGRDGTLPNVRLGNELQVSVDLDTKQIR